MEVLEEKPKEETEEKEANKSEPEKPSNTLDVKSADAGPPKPPLSGRPSQAPPKEEKVSVQRDTALLKYPEYIDNIKLESFYTENLSLLTKHKFVQEATNGKLSTNRAKRFVAENFYVLKSDLRSFEVACDMYGGMNDTYGKFFEFLRVAASYSDIHLQNLRQALKMTEAELHKYEPSPKTMCYPAYFSWLITHTNPATIAVCYAVHYPTWGKMCKSMLDGIIGTPKYRLNENDLLYFKFLSEPLIDMDIMVKEIMTLADKEEPLEEKRSYKQVKDSVRTLQGYLINFWDGICEGAYCA